MGHGTPSPVPGGHAPDAEVPVEGIAEILRALSTPSRLRILLRLARGPCPVGELAAAIGMEQSAVSHQLRVLRHLGFVVGDRDGKQVCYRLHDQHVARLLREAVDHVEHRRLGVTDSTDSTDAPGAAPLAPR